MNPFSRREFLAHSLVGVGLTMSAGSRAMAAEVAASQIDCHTHFYRRGAAGSPVPGMETPADLKAVACSLGVTGTVVVEASPLVEDNQWLLDLAKDDPFIVGVVGNLTPGVAEFAKHIKRFAADERYRGIRVNADKLAAGLNEKSYLEDLQRFADHDLALDVNGGPETAAVVARLAKQLPGLRIVINHAACPGVVGKTPPKAWSDGVKAAAEYPQVFCKVSALVDQSMWRGRKAPSELTIYQPLLDALWNIWGDDRLIYGSNWPVSEQYASYAVVHGIVDQYVTAKGAEARATFFASNSQRAYRWKSRSRK